MVDVFHGMFAANTASGNQTITGVGFSGKIFLFYSTNKNNKDGSYSGHYMNCIGMADGATLTSRAITMNSSDIVTNSDVGARSVTSGCVCVCTASGTRGINASLDSVNSDGFVLRWDSQIPALAISGWVGFDVIGGADVVNQKIVDLRYQSGHGSQTVSGVGFSGNLAIVLAAASGFNQNATTNASTTMHIGMATGPSDEAGMSFFSQDAANTSITRRWPRTDRFLLRISNTGVATGQAEFTNFHSDGITLNWISGATVSALCSSLLVAHISGNVKVVSWNTTSGTDNQTITGVGFSGKYVLMASTDTASNNVASTSGHNRMSIGSATSSTARGAAWAGDQNGAATMVNTRTISDTRCFIAAIENATDSSTSGVMIADFVQFNANGYEVDKITNAFNGDTSGMTISSLVIGDTISGAAPEVTPEDTRRQAFAGGNYPSPMMISTSPFPAQMPAYSESRPIFGPLKPPEPFMNVSGQLLY